MNEIENKYKIEFDKLAKILSIRLKLYAFPCICLTINSYKYLLFRNKIFCLI